MIAASDPLVNCLLLLQLVFVYMSYKNLKIKIISDILINTFVINFRCT